MTAIERRDASILERWDLDTRTYTRLDAGTPVEERPFTEAEARWLDDLTVEDTRTSNEVQLLRQARIAYDNNKIYLALVAAGTATNADHIQQIPRLTRQLQAVIQLLVRADLLD